jgi:hypothetical protein
VPNSNYELDMKLDGNPHKITLKYIISMIKTYVNGDTETLDFINFEVAQI